MRFRELPGFSALFSDYVEGVRPARQFFPCPADADGLRSRAIASQRRLLPRGELCDLLLRQAEWFGSGEPAVSNIVRLRDPQTVTVAVTLRPALLGGPLCSWLAILTAGRLAAWLTDQGFPAVPMGWIDRRTDPAARRVGLLARAGPRRLELDLPPGPAAVISAGTDDLLAQVAAAMEIGLEESDVLQLLRASCAPGTDFLLAWGRSVSKLLESVGLILLDPMQAGMQLAAPAQQPPLDGRDLEAVQTRQDLNLRAAGYPPDAAIGHAAPALEDQDASKDAPLMAPLVRQHLLLPVAANVIGEADAYAFARDQALLPLLGLPVPMAWPRVSATVLDARSRKMIARYGLRFEELFAGPEIVAGKLAQRRAAGDTVGRFDALKAELDRCLTALAKLVPPEDRLKADVASSRRRMIFQVEKLKNLYIEARLQRREAITRQVARLCGALAPWGRLQEMELAGFQFMLRHSPALPQILYNSIDPWKFEHQLIPVD